MASEYDAHEPGTWREAALDFRAENERMRALLAERDARIKTLENDLEHALASVGAFRQAVENVFAKAEEHEVDQGGMIVTYVLPCGPLHRAIGLTRGTDAGGKLLKRLGDTEAERDDLAARLAAAEATMDSPTWPYVLAFARQMEGKLDQNRHKGNREGWLKDAPIDLLARLVEEVVELQHAIDRGWPTDDVAGEAADVANFALMVADAYRHRNGSRAALAGGRERAQGEGA